MIEKIKALLFGKDGTVIVIALAVVGALACFFYGAHVERLKADKEIADLRRDYAQNERDALRRAEEIRQEQEAKFLVEMAALKRDAADRLSDAERVRQQFDELKSRRSATLEQCNHRASRCEQLLSEAYELAGEGEGLLRDRDARLTALSVAKDEGNGQKE